MLVDESGLIHGGFIFSLADYSAMLTINHPNVVLGGADVKFIKPVVLGDIMVAEGTLTKKEGKKHIVNVIVKKEKVIVFKGTFICFTPENHVLKRVC